MSEHGMKLQKQGCMTVGELIRYLQDEDEDAYVVFASNYGDRCGTLQALPIVECEDMEARGEMLSDTAYSVSELSLVDERGSENEVSVVVLS